MCQCQIWFVCTRHINSSNPIFLDHVYKWRSERYIIRNHPWHGFFVSVAYIFLSEAYLLMAIIRHLSFREIYFLYHRFLQVLARRVLFGYPSKCYFEHCIKKTWKMVSLIFVKYPLGFFFNLPEPRVQGSFFWTLFVWRPSFYLSGNARLQTFSFLTSSPEQSVILTKFGNLLMKSFKVCSNDGPILKGDPVIKLKNKTN